MDQPLDDHDLSALAQACEERAWELQARAWQTEADRNALREATADLLTMVARRLAPRDPSKVAGLEGDGVRTLIDKHVLHSSLQAAQYHAWIRAFAPGGAAEPSPPAGDASNDPPATS